KAACGTRSPPRGNLGRRGQALRLALHRAGAQGRARLLQIAARPQAARGGAQRARPEHEERPGLGRPPVAGGHRQDARGNEEAREGDLAAAATDDQFLGVTWLSTTLTSSSSGPGRAACAPRALPPATAPASWWPRSTASVAPA